MENDFEEIWQKYPRKVAKAQAKKIWARMSAEKRNSALAALPEHLKAWELEGRLPQYYPHLGTWLYQERWEDEIEAVEAIPQKVVAWWANDEGVMAKGRELGIFPRGGEGMAQYKARVVEAARKAA